ncbi:hypothetical protein BJ508DRAFT_315198 [Ascobolus immersus RN42]|uniref:Uncharacterized protein n=1 Tax=Ascobolus immersus RN42 TaxID=1160509 RepID=A0A3N4HIV3_ASCIM|nr:hypothetical protein BJ508DRAFT_315198 [Ascobolus immersus RN42]
MSQPQYSSAMSVDATTPIVTHVVPRPNSIMYETACPPSDVDEITQAPKRHAANPSAFSPVDHKLQGLSIITQIASNNNMTISICVEHPCRGQPIEGVIRDANDIFPSLNPDYNATTVAGTPASEQYLYCAYVLSVRVQGRITLRGLVHEIHQALKERHVRLNGGNPDRDFPRFIRRMVGYFKWIPTPEITNYFIQSNKYKVWKTTFVVIWPERPVWTAFSDEWKESPTHDEVNEQPDEEALLLEQQLLEQQQQDVLPEEPTAGGSGGGALSFVVQAPVFAMSFLRGTVDVVKEFFDDNDVPYQSGGDDDEYDSPGAYEKWLIEPDHYEEDLHREGQAEFSLPQSPTPKRQKKPRGQRATVSSSWRRPSARIAFATKAKSTVSSDLSLSAPSRKGKGNVDKDFASLSLDTPAPCDVNRTSIDSRTAFLLSPEVLKAKPLVSRKTIADGVAEYRGLLDAELSRRNSVVDTGSKRKLRSHDVISYNLPELLREDTRDQVVESVEDPFPPDAAYLSSAAGDSDGEADEEYKPVVIPEAMRGEIISIFSGSSSPEAKSEDESGHLPGVKKEFSPSSLLSASGYADIHSDHPSNVNSSVFNTPVNTLHRAAPADFDEEETRESPLV